ncbi:MAG: hypothetical protein JNJ73_14635 [Hyphomonadaceae bacterium]|nr:hypothetical protein [Hyphomonadaceae bacterium]
MKRIAIIATGVAAGLLAAACTGEPPQQASAPPLALAQAEHVDFTFAYETSEPQREMRPAYRTEITADEAALGEVAAYSIDQHGRILEAAPRDPGMEPADAPAEMRWGEPVV